MDNEQNDQTQNNPAEQPTLQSVAGPADVAAKHTRNKRRKQVFFAGLAGIVLVAGGAVGALTLFGNDDTEPVTVEMNQQQEEEAGVVKLAAAISVVEGNVQYSSDANAWTDASGGETVQAGEYVRTLDGARTVLLIDDGSAVRLDANSQIQLVVSDTMSVEVMLMSGQVYSRVTESDSRTFAVVTENERFEAQGTAYKTTTGEFDAIEVYQSAVKVDSDDQTIDEGNKYDTNTKEKTSIDLASLSSDDFVQWNKQKDSESSDFKDKLGVLANSSEEAPAAEPAPVDPSASISLSGQAVDSGVSLSWSLSNVSSQDGFKIVRDVSDTTPSYGEHKSVYISSGQQRNYTVDVQDGKTYHFRVCIYRAASGSCDTYSNSITVTAPLKALEQVTPGAVTLSIADDKINWSFAGTAPHGFKVVLSEAQNPTYPANSIQYVGAGTVSTTLPEKPAGTYYVRVCKYTASSDIDGGCTDYSNQVTYTVSE